MVDMNNRGTKLVIDENDIDKISNLPMDILDKIFKDMSFLELVKTCVLSKKWVHFWAMHPILVLDGDFFRKISGNIKLIEDGFSGLIDKILFQHVGSIVKFSLDLSTIYYNNNRDLGHWLICVTSKCVKELTLKNHKHKHYNLPFCVFDCPTLTYLDVTNFIVKLPSSKTLFPNLLELTLKSIKFRPTNANYVLNAPFLTSLTLISCNGVHWLTIFAPRIKFLTINDSHDICANFFVNFSNVRELLFREESYYEEGRFITWSHLLSLCPNLTRLVLNNSCIQVFNTLRERNIGEVIHYLEDPKCIDQQFEKLEFVELRKFEGTHFELIFLKKILGYSPSLSRIIVEPSDDIDVAEILDLYEELMMFLKASPTVKVVVAPHG
uniref:F-box domain-containing protein n=1 Tax=Solanum lycopersicum TaxID=4081 RepID=A0A3Q7FIB3_SOLLC